MLEASRRPLVAEIEFLALPESVDKVELVDGEVIVSPSPSFWHQELLQRLVFVLRSWAAGHDEPVTIGQAPLDVRFGEGRILQPDAFVLLGAIAPDHQGPIDHPVAICIEVLSSNRAYDRLTKRFVYAQAGVKEYWLVEPSGLIERWSGEGLASAEEVTGQLCSPLLPGFEVELEELFAS